MSVALLGQLVFSWLEHLLFAFLCVISRYLVICLFTK